MDGTERWRGSLGRFVEKLRKSFRRRSSSGQNGSALVQNEVSTSNTLEQVPEARREAVDDHADNQQPDDTGEDEPAPGSKLEPIAADNEQSQDGPSVESLLPMRPGRSAFSQEKAQALFERYGIKVEALPPSTGVDDKRRVQKPIRIRIHWTCHDCQTPFGSNKTCTKCGHRRCSDCTRAPPKKVREALEQAKKDTEQKPSSGQPLAGVTAAVVIESPEPDSQAPANTSQAQELEPRGAEDLASDNESPNEPSYMYVQQHRQSAGMDPVLPMDRQSSRRTCHECHAHIDPENQTECPNCQHEICSRCPREHIRRSRWGMGSPGETEGDQNAPTTTVQRVYRKPRQRIRWSCHDCGTMFIEKKTCKNCGHERCKKCTRTPSKKIAVPPSAEVLQSVADKLAHLDVAQPPPETAPGAAY